MAELDSILRRIQGLLANADDPATTPEAAASYRAKADALLFKYNIDQAMADASRPADQRATPVWTTVIAGAYDSEFRDSYAQIVGTVMTHTGTRGVSTYVDGRAGYKLVGFESDVRYAELLITSALIEFQRRLEPTVDPALGDDANAYRLRHAGWEGSRIAWALWGVNDKASRSKARNAFRREALRLGEDPAPLLGNGNSVAVYRTSYADEFTWTLHTRLSAIRRARAEDERGLVLAGRAGLVDEALYAEYPHLRPTSTVERYRDPREGCTRCAKASRGYCREHAYLKPAKSVERRHSAAGAAAGAAAARRVDLGPGTRGRVEGQGHRAVGA